MKKYLYFLPITLLVAFLSCQDEPVIMINGHEAVDLGLPSGTMWATCNVGAETPEEEGTPFAYGETKGKSTYNWANYQLVDLAEGNGRDQYKRYNSRKNSGVIDNLEVLLRSDDAATVAWGDDWFTPTKEDVEELVEKCHFKYEMHDDTEGYVVTGPSGKSIYVAFNQVHDSDTTWTHYEGSFMRTSTVLRDDAGYCHHAWVFAVSRRAGLVHSYRYVGLPVRPVCRKKGTRH